MNTAQKYVSTKNNAKKWLPLTTAFLNVIGIENSPSAIYYPATAYEVTGREIWLSVNRFEQRGITEGWLKYLTACYLYIGGASDSCKYNFINPQDTDEAFRLSFFGGLTFSATGCKPNGVNGWADSHINASTNLEQYSLGVSFYSRDAVASNVNSFWFSNGAENVSSIELQPRNVQQYFALNGERVQNLAGDLDGARMITTQRVSDSLIEMYNNGALHTSGASPFVSALNQNLYFHRNFVYTSSGFFSNQEVCFASVQKSMSENKISLFRNSVQSLQIALKRQV